MGLLRSTIIISLVLLLSACGEKKSTANTDHFKTIQCKNDVSLLKLNSSSLYNLEKNEVSKWHHASSQRPMKGVIVLVHGLNFKPSKLDSMASSLAKKGHSVLRVGLSGHRGSFTEAQEVSRPQWLLEVFDHICLARRKAEADNVPLIAIGHSLGGLLISDLMNLNSSMQIDKLVFLAPAIRIRWYGKIAESLYQLFPKLSLPSFSFKEYRANSKTPLVAFNALKESRQNVQKISPTLASVSTLVFMDTKDELVDYHKVNQLVTKLPMWKLITIDNKDHLLSRSFHHLIIDKDSTGAKQWKKINQYIIRHLEN